MLLRSLLSALTLSLAATAGLLPGPAASLGAGSRSEPVAVSGRWATGDGTEHYVTRRTTYRVDGTVRTPPRLRARAWAVADLDTGRLLGTFAHRAHLPQASTIKLLTALTASRTVPADVRHRVRAAELRRVVCSCAGLVRGGRYTRGSMLAGMLLPSGNDAAEALAASHPDGRAAFLSAMRATAETLGASDTVVRNPTGLTAEGAHSSARDLLLLLRAAAADEVVAPYLSMPSAVVENLRGEDRTLHGPGRAPDRCGHAGGAERLVDDRSPGADRVGRAEPRSAASGRPAAAVARAQCGCRLHSSDWVSENR